MAKMIPPVVGPNVSRGEREVFDRLRLGRFSGDWIVLHSLDIAHHRRQVSGEADFIIIIPRKGVLCLEVKGCGQLRREQGVWFYGRDGSGDSRGPFRQAAEAMHSLRKRISERCPPLSRIVYWSAVAFPFVDFSVQSEEWHAWQVIDRRSFRSKALDLLLKDILDRAHKRLRECAAVTWYRPSSGEPDIEQCQTIAELLRPDFECFESPADRVRMLDGEVKKYTDEQFVALDFMELNPRVVFSGPAGTGKTVLALESARRAALSGRRVLLLCFNQLLGRWLESQTRTLHPYVRLCTLHSFMLATSEAPVPPNAGREFWEETVPLLALEKLIDLDAPGYDELIIDEAQDLLRENYLDLLDASLMGGLSSGWFKFFGDFERQAIYARGASLWQSILDNRGVNAASFSLRINCRNTPRIASLVRLLGGLEPDYVRVLRPDDGVEPEIHYFPSKTEQVRLLEQWLNTLLKSGFSPERITVLSARADESCAARMLADSGSALGETVSPYRTVRPGQIGYCSIHAFKGLEAGAIVVTDIDGITGRDADLYYIAATRALHRLVILSHDSVKKQVIAKLLGIGAR